MDGTVTTSLRPDVTATETKWNVLDLFSGLSTVLDALQQTGRAVNQYRAVEIDAEALAMAEHLAARVASERPTIVPPQVAKAMHSALPRDIKLITEDMIKQLPRVDLLVATWPCQDLSAAQSKSKPMGPNGPRASLFWDAYRVLGWVQEHNNPHVRFVFENAGSMNRIHPKAQDTYTRALRVHPIVIDNASVGYAHRTAAHLGQLHCSGSDPSRGTGLRPLPRSRSPACDGEGARSPSISAVRQNR